jgi:hypothetical protein
LSALLFNPQNFLVLCRWWLALGVSFLITYTFHVFEKSESKEPVGFGHLKIGKVQKKNKNRSKYYMIQIS